MSKFAACHCNNVAVGSYDNQVSMKSPYVQRNNGWVCIDTCIATEIGWLWHQGIYTLNSCCGHGLYHSWVIVHVNDDKDMPGLGYESEPTPGGHLKWLLKTGTRL